MRSGKTEAVSEAGVGWLRFAIADRLGWIFREQTTQDKGVDAHVEEVIDGKATGRLIGIQIKSGMSWMKEKSRNGFLFRGDLEHLSYWRGHSLPIVIVLFDPTDKEAYWQLVSEENIRETRKGWSLVVPFTQRITEDIRPAWSYICSSESSKAFLRKQQIFARIARSFETEFNQRQTLLYRALHQTTRSLLVSTPSITEDILSVLDFMSVRLRVCLLIGAEQPDNVWKLIQSRAGQGAEVRVCPSLHLKQVIFDSLLLMAGSANLTSFGLHRPSEQFLFVANESACQGALRDFFDLWEGRAERVFEYPESIPSLSRR